MHTLTRIVVAAGIVASATAAEAAVRLELVARGMVSAVAYVPDPVLPDTAFVVLQDGVVRVISGGVEQESPFLDLRDEISRGGERGLLGWPFHRTPLTRCRCS